MKVDARIEKLFVCLAAAKHLKFTAAFPTEGAVNVAKVVWQNGLQELSNEELGAGIKALADWKPESGEDRLPTLMEFKNLLCPRIPKQKLLTVDNSKPYVPASQETYKQNMREILEKLKGKCKTESLTILNNIDKRIEQEPYYTKS